MFHVCLAVQHMHECHGDIDWGLSQKAVHAQFLIGLRKQIAKKQVTIKLHPQRMLKDKLNFDIGLIKLDRKVIFGPDLSPDMQKA